MKKIIQLILLLSLTACASKGRSSYDQKDLVKTQLKLNLPRFNKCYRRELDRGSRANGEVVMDFVIDVYGNVVDAKTDAPETFSRKFIQCMKNVLGYIQFEDLYNRNDISFTQAFNFDRNRINRRRRK